jgi:streptogramin lyase
LSDPRAIAVDSRGNAYIADNGNHAIRMVVGGALP